MVLKIILFAIAGILLYRVLGGKIPIIDRERREKRDSSDDFTKVAPTAQCAICGTYMTEDDAIIYHKKSYCSNECLEKAQKGR
jgi:uncharacterized protein